MYEDLQYQNKFEDSITESITLTEEQFSHVNEITFDEDISRLVMHAVSIPKIRIPENVLIACLSTSKIGQVYIPQWKGKSTRDIEIHMTTNITNLKDFTDRKIKNTLVEYNPINTIIRKRCQICGNKFRYTDNHIHICVRKHNTPSQDTPLFNIS